MGRTRALVLCTAMMNLPPPPLPSWCASVAIASSEWKSMDAINIHLLSIDPTQRDIAWAEDISWADNNNSKDLLESIRNISYFLIHYSITFALAIDEFESEPAT